MASAPLVTRRLLYQRLPETAPSAGARGAACAGPRRHRQLGLNSNELLPHRDWDLIAVNPKIFCGYSDITAVQNAILARTGMIT